MGNYMTQSNLERYLSDANLQALTDDDGSGSIDTGVVTKEIAAAESEVDAYLNVVYDTPLTTVPDIVTEWSTILCTYRLYLRRRSVPDDINEAAKVARSQLVLVMKGQMKLDIGDTPPEESTGLEPVFQYNERVFSRSKFSGY